MKRAAHFDRSVQHKLIKCAQSVNADIAIISGDMTALSLHDEFKMARSSLKPFLVNQTSFVIAGNHDVYTKSSEKQQRFQRYFHEWMGEPITKFFGGDGDGDGDVRVLQSHGVTILGVNSVQATYIGSRGYIRPQQLKQLEKVLSGNSVLQNQVANNVILTLHYPVVDRDGRAYHKQHFWHGISNGDELIHVLSNAAIKPKLILHGHAHKGSFTSY